MLSCWALDNVHGIFNTHNRDTVKFEHEYARLPKNKQLMKKAVKDMTQSALLELWPSNHRSQTCHVPKIQGPRWTIILAIEYDTMIQFDTISSNKWIYFSCLFSFRDLMEAYNVMIEFYVILFLICRWFVIVTNVRDVIIMLILITDQYPHMTFDY